MCYNQKAGKPQIFLLSEPKKRKLKKLKKIKKTLYKSEKAMYTKQVLW